MRPIRSLLRGRHRAKLWGSGYPCPSILKIIGTASHSSLATVGVATTQHSIQLPTLGRHRFCAPCSLIAGWWGPTSGWVRHIRGGTPTSRTALLDDNLGSATEFLEQRLSCSTFRFEILPLPNAFESERRCDEHGISV